MATLSNWRLELFARELSEVMLLGLKPKDYAQARLKAYVNAGYAANMDNSRRDANRLDVKQRVAQLYATALEYRDIRPFEVVTRIDRIGRARLSDFFEKNDKGEIVLKDITQLSVELAEALAAIEFDDNGRPKIKLHDKNQANIALLKHLGGIPDDGADRRPVNVNIFAGLSVDEQRALAEALEALPAGPAVAGPKAA